MKKKPKRKPDPKGRRLLTNTAIFAGIAIFLSVYFSMNYLWSIGTVVVVILVLLLGALQLWIYYEFFYKDGRK